MKTEEKKRVANTLTEKPTVIRVGKMLFKARPLTLAQIYEMGAVANDISADDLMDLDSKIRVVPALVAHHKDAQLMQQVFIICLFRKRWKRWLFGRYIRRRLTVAKFQELITYISTSFDANFFLTSIIFLRQTTVMTEPSQTTVHGQQ